MKWDCEALVIGSGFGGSINSLRLSKKWPGKVILIERGKRYSLGSFPRSPKGMADNFFNLKEENHKRPANFSKKNNTGLFDIRSYNHIDVVLSAGYGGGSLIYANVFLPPPDEVFDERWPKNCKKSDFEPYYKICKEVLGSRPIPGGKDWELNKIKYFQNTAKKMGRKSELVDLNVFFGPDEKNTIPQGTQSKNKYGALQTSCNYCAECDIGCNTRSKNTLDLNYLYVAETNFGLNVFTEHKATKISPLDDQGNQDPKADGNNGYCVEVKDLKTNEVKKINCRRVIISAGTLGTNELLLKCKQEFKTLPQISNKLGKSFSGNGDFLSFIINSQENVDPTHGPVITQRIDFNLFENFNKNHAFIMEDASYPNIIAWFAEGEKPGFMKFSAIINTARAFIKKFLFKPNLGRMGEVLSQLLSSDLSSRSSVHLCMGYDKSNGTMNLDETCNLYIDWPYKSNMDLYKSINQSVTDFANIVNGSIDFPLPTWEWPARRNVTVHPLGGCTVAESPDAGVTDCHPQRFGQVFNYKNLFVADGSILPTAVGANPSLTISAMAERVAEAITKIKPDSDLLDKDKELSHAS